MQELCGYALIKENATTGVTSGNIEDFTNGHRVRVLEFNKDGGVLVINSNADAIATFDAVDVAAKFECKEHGDILCDSSLDYLQTIEYTERVRRRLGGYNRLIKELIINSSLHRGKFTDSVLWAKS